MQKNVSRQIRRPLVIFTLALVALYALTYHGFTGSVIDEVTMLSVSSQIVDAHSVQITPLSAALEAWGAPQADVSHPVYSKYPIGQSLLALPLYSAGSILSHLVPGGLGITNAPNGIPFLPTIPLLIAFLMGTVTTLLSVFGVLYAGRLLGCSARGATLLALLYATTTLAWPYAKTFYNEPSTACVLIWLVYFTIRYRRDRLLLDGLAAGACIGLAILLRTSSAIFAPLLLIYLAPRWQRYVTPLIGIGIGLALTFAYNLYRFGSITESGYEPGFGRAPWEALLGYLISPSRSVFLFNPILLLAIPGAFWLSRRLPGETLFVIALSIAPAVIYAAWWAWDGGSSLGSRFFVPSIPLAMLLIVPLIERVRWRPALIILGVAGFGLQILCNLAMPGDFYFDLFTVQHVSPSAVNWQWHASILANLWATFSGHRIDSSLLRALPLHSPLFMALLFTILAGVLVSIMLWAALHVKSARILESEIEQSDASSDQENQNRGLSNRISD